MKFANLVEADKTRGEWTDPRAGRVTFAEKAAEVMSHRVHVEVSTSVRDEQVMRRLVLPYLAESQLAKVEKSDIQRWVNQLITADYAPTTIRKAYDLGARVFDEALDDQMITRTPCRNITLPKLKTRVERRFLEPAEVQQLSEAIDPDFRVLVLAAAATGLRWGELAGLKVGRLDMLRRSLRVEGSLSEVGGVLALKSPKTASSKRTVALPAFLVDDLARHLADHPTDGLVFRSKEGGPLRRQNFRSRFWLPAVRASIGEPCRFHDLRHSHAATLIAEGVHPKVIQERLGHSSIKTTMDTYGHLFDGLDAAAADALDAAFARPHVDEMWTKPAGQVVPFQP